MRSPRGPYAHAPRLPGGEDERSPVVLASIGEGELIELEIGPGPKAGFLLERAIAAPEALLIGLEIRRKWATVGDEKLKKAGHGGRARVFCEDARSALPRLTPDGCVRRVFLHFPDPWWKKRHHKRLVMGDAFLIEVVRLLEPHRGELYIQTDVEERAELYASVVAMNPELVPAGDREGSPNVTDNPFNARSPREHRAIADGLPVHRMLWRRR